MDFVIKALVFRAAAFIRNVDQNNGKVCFLFPPGRAHSTGSTALWHNRLINRANVGACLSLCQGTFVDLSVMVDKR